MKIPWLSRQWELKQQAKYQVDEMRELLNKGFVDKAIAKFNLAERFFGEVFELLPESLKLDLEQERARRHLDPQLWMFLTGQQTETEPGGLIEPGKINQIGLDDSLESIDPDLWLLLDSHQNEAGFLVRWQAFVRACSLLVPGLPEEARNWIEIADNYQLGRITLAEFMAAGMRAGDFYDAQQATKSPSELSCLAVVRYCFCLPYWHWDLCAASFFGDLEAAGITVSHWWPLLQACYPAILHGLRQP